MPFFGAIPQPPALSPINHGVVNGNGNAQPNLPPLHPSHIPPLQPQLVPESSRGAFYDPTQDDVRAPDAESEYAGRHRAHSSAHAPPSEAQSMQNGERAELDTEMGDAPGGGFTSVNR
jgi:hypothetical protein